MGWYRRATLTAKITPQYCTIRHPIQRTHKLFHTSPSPTAISPPKLYQRWSGFIGELHQDRLRSPFVYGARRYYYRDRQSVTDFQHRGYRSWLNNAAFNVFRKIKSKITPQIQRIHKLLHTSPLPASISPPICSGFMGGLHQDRLRSPFFYGARRYYYRFRQRGFRRWFNNSKGIIYTAVLALVIGTGIVITAICGSLETIPYTNRTHFVLLSHNWEKYLGESYFEDMKAEEFKGKILPEIHPDSVRVRLIAKDIISALHRGLSKEKVRTDLEYASNMLMALSNSREKGKGKKTEIEHLESFNWEIMVVEDSVVNAFCLPGGKIVVYTGLLEKFRTDDEIATVIGHEVAHAVARHSAEGITKQLWTLIVQLILLQFVTHEIANSVASLFLSLPFSRKMEMEADYIGLLLSASAGYDPRIAPGVYKKLNEISGGDSCLDDYLSTHPSGKKRARLLAEPKVMEKALLLYSEATSDCWRGIEGFLKRKIFQIKCFHFGCCNLNLRVD